MKTPLAHNSAPVLAEQQPSLHKDIPRTNIPGAYQTRAGQGGRLSNKQTPAIAVAEKKRHKRLKEIKKRIYATLVILAAVIYSILVDSDRRSAFLSWWIHLSCSRTQLGWIVISCAIIACLSLTASWKSNATRAYLIFAWNCFIKPFLKSKPQGITSDEHQKRLEDFYEGQADVYDITRKTLLRGRTTMLKLASAQLKQVFPCTEFSFVNECNFRVPKNDPAVLPSFQPSSSLIMNSPNQTSYCWIDIGGGTGENIQKMHASYLIHNFTKVYCVDITPSLCAIARKRFERLGWDNVVVVCADAGSFKVPESDGPMQVALITMSYSLSMMETFYPMVDHLSELLSPDGVIGIVDFYVSSKRTSDPTFRMSWFMRWFWCIWFDLDNIYLHSSRHEYMCHKFKTIKSLSCRNLFIKPFVKIPYYIWIGAKKDIMKDLVLNPSLLCETGKHANNVSEFTSKDKAIDSEEQDSE